MNGIQEVDRGVKDRFPQALTTLDQPENETGNWWLDIKYAGQHIPVEWRPKEGFGVMPITKNEGYGDRPYVIVATAEQAIRTVLNMLGDINLAEIPELASMTIIEGEEVWHNFATSLPQDIYPYQQLVAQGLPLAFSAWLSSVKPGTKTFYAVRHEPKKQAAGGWQYHDLYRCIALCGADGRVYVLKDQIQRFHETWVASP